MLAFFSLLWVGFPVSSTGHWLLSSRLGGVQHEYYSNARTDELEHNLYALSNMDMEEVGRSTGKAIGAKKHLAFAAWFGLSAAAGTNAFGVGSNPPLLQAASVSSSPVSMLWGQMATENGDRKYINEKSRQLFEQIFSDIPDQYTTPSIADAAMEGVVKAIDDTYMDKQYGLGRMLQDEDMVFADAELVTDSQVPRHLLHKQVSETTNKVKEKTKTWVVDVIERGIEEAIQDQRYHRHNEKNLAEREKIGMFVGTNMDDFFDRLEPFIQDRAWHTAGGVYKLEHEIVDQIVAGVQIRQHGDSTEWSTSKVQAAMQGEAAEIGKALEDVAKGKEGNDDWIKFKEMVKNGPLASVMEGIKALGKKKNGDNNKDSWTSAKRLQRLQDDFLYAEWMRKQNRLQKWYRNEQ